MIRDIDLAIRELNRTMAEADNARFNKLYRSRHYSLAAQLKAVSRETVARRIIAKLNPLPFDKWEFWE